MALRPLTDDEIGELLAPALAAAAVESGVSQEDLIEGLAMFAACIAVLEGVGVVFATEDDGESLEG